MENPVYAYQNRAIVNSNSIAGNLIHTTPEHADGHQRRLRPMQTDFFREISLFNAHFGSEPESSRWAKLLPEYLRPGNLEDHLKQTKKPKLFGNNFWWALQESPGQDCNGRFTTASQKKIPTVSDGQKDMQSSKISSSKLDHIRYSREQLLQLRKVKTVPVDIMKIKQEIEVEFLGVKQMIENESTASWGNVGGIGWVYYMHSGHCLKSFKVVKSGSNGENESNLKENKEEKRVAEKKRKRGMSDEKRAKKKMKERKKRAEKNRQLGVKRLKIQPVVNQKPVSHCRHYMHGRCYEGEKCKFSHDVVPLTKSKPCCHFSRQACMKGDDCPFDHQLSKYPCNNYVSTGHCNRGDNCLFSHKITPKQDSVPSICPNSDSLQQVKDSPNIPFGVPANYKQANPFQKPHSLFESGSPASTVKSPAQPFTVDSTKPKKTPKGLTFLNTAMDEKTPKIVSNSSTDLVASGGDKKDSGDTNQKLNLVPFKFPGSTSSSSPFLNRLDNAQVKNVSSSGKRSLLATLGFASKFDSGTKTSTATQHTESPIKNVGLGISSITNPFEL